MVIRSDFKIVAHRGGAALAPENTMSAFNNAYKLGARAVELDIHPSKDGELIVMHDPTVDRTTNGHGAIRDMTLEQLRQLDAGSKFSPLYVGEKIPVLKEVLDSARGKATVFVEVKEGKRPADFEDRLLNCIGDQQDGVLVMSFDKEFIHHLEKRVPNLRTGVLLPEGPVVTNLKRGGLGGAIAGLVGGGLAGGLTGALVGSLGGALAGAGLGYGLAQRQIESWAMAEKGQTDTILPSWAGLSAGMVGRIHAQGMEVIPYTADAPLLVHHLFKAGCDAVITNHPDRYLHP